MAYINVLENKGYFALRLGKLRLVSGMLFVQDNKLVLKRKKGELVIRLNNDKYDRYSIVSVLKGPLANQISLRKLHMFLEAGSSQSAYSTAILTAFAESFAKLFLAVMSSKHPQMRLMTDFYPVFGKDELELTVDGIASFSLLNILSGMVGEIVKTFRIKHIKHPKNKLKEKIENASF